eukprot:3993886-Amphidinium_carterae.1
MLVTRTLVSRVSSVTLKSVEAHDVMSTEIVSFTIVVPVQRVLDSLYSGCLSHRGTSLCVRLVVLVRIENPHDWLFCNVRMGGHSQCPRLQPPWISSDRGG